MSASRIPPDREGAVDSGAAHESVTIYVAAGWAAPDERARWRAAPAREGA